MARRIDDDAVKRRIWNIVEKWKYQGRKYDALLLESVIAQIVDTQPTLTPPNEWVSVEERLPNSQEDVLVVAFWHERWQTMVGWHSDMGRKWRIITPHGEREPGGVTHWMPLPASPDKDNNVPGKTQNEPLTLEQLREMDGDPVWFVDIKGRKWYPPGWAIVDRENCLVRLVKSWNPIFFEKYGEWWLAYRRPPEGEEDA